MRTHLCDNHPDDPGSWQDGTVSACLYHGYSGKKQLGFRWGRKIRAEMDSDAGEVGQTRDGYINAT